MEIPTKLRSLSTRTLALIPLCIICAVSCGKSAEAPLEFVLKQSGPSSSVAVKTTPEKVNKPPCTTEECCETELNVVVNECVSVELSDGVCTKTVLADGVPCGDASELCGSTPDTCMAGVCSPGDPGEDCTQIAHPECQKPICDPETNKCVIAYEANGTVCDDGDVCNGSELCNLGACENGEPLDCNDNNSCTADVCEADTGCTNNPIEGKPCDDGNICSLDDACDDSGECTGGDNICPCENDGDCGDKSNLCTGELKCINNGCEPTEDAAVNCDDANPCTTDSCDPSTGQCINTPNNDSCNDGDKCTLNDACADGECKGESKDCDDNNSCTVGDACASDTGECTYASNTCECEKPSDCPELSPCDGTYTCTDNLCTLVSDSAVDCSDYDAVPCQAAQCNPESGQCEGVPVADGGPCDDGDQCTESDTCTGGLCAGTPTEPCNDDNPCTSDSCQPADGCVYAPLAGGDCDDGNTCTIGDTCLDGQCKGAAPLACNDGNTCTKDSCDPKTGCVNSVLSATACDDGNKCTVGDTCDDGVCTAGKNTCGCVLDSECKDDGNLCNGIPVCTAGECVIKPGSAVTCNPGGTSACMAMVCQPSTGLCEPSQVSNGTLCDDSDACTSGDVCLNGTCKGAAKVCDDGNSCTADTCDKDEGCQTEWVTGPCDDDNKCTVGESCQDGKCQGGKALDCNDSELCTVDQCLPKTGCKYGPSIGMCDDGDACTTNNFCLQGKCTGTPVSCEDPDKCHTSACDPSSGDCALTPVPCDDGNSCTDNLCENDEGCTYPTKNCDDNLECTSDSCDPLTDNGCINKALNCNDGNLCTTDSCDPDTGDCAFIPLDCSDDNLCTKDTCVAGQCKNDIIECNDNDACTKDLCDGGDCTNLPIDCSDNNPCTVDKCTGGNCTNKLKDCNDNNDCTTDSCSNGSCQNKNIDCSDNNPCTVDKCTGGNCTNKLKDCNDNNDCTTESCLNGSCQYTDVVCDDDNPCTSDECVNGDCTSTLKDCNDNNNCTTDSCSNGSCQNTGVVCDDDNKCTNDECSDGECVYDPIQCDDNDSCTLDSCLPDFGCISAQQNCADGFSCTQDSCVNGECEHKPNNDVCNDNNPCTEDLCLVTEGCTNDTDHTASGDSCNDDNDLTASDFCLEGVCEGLVISQPNMSGISSKYTLTRTMYTAGEFYVIGKEDGNSPDAFAARVIDGNLNVVQPSIKKWTTYVAISDDVIVNDDAEVLSYESNGWTYDNSLHFSLQKLNFIDGATAAWGSKQTNNARYFFAGRTNSSSWVAQCSGSSQYSCNYMNVDMDSAGSFKNNERPRALAGWVSETSQDAYGVTLLSDFRDNPNYYNDAFHYPNPSLSWEFSIYDQSPAKSVSRDVHGTGYDNMWWAGSLGLMRTSSLSDDNTPTWNTISALKAPNSIDLSGVYANEEFVIFTATRRLDSNSFELSLLVHAIGTDVNDPAAWKTIPITTVNNVASARLEDVWLENNQLVVTGWKNPYGFYNSVPILAVRGFN